MLLGTEVNVGQATLLDGDPSRFPNSLPAPRQFLAHVCCGQMAGWMKMPLTMEVGFSLGDIVLDGDPSSPKRGTAPPLIGPCLLRPNGWMNQDAAWYGG